MPRGKSPKTIALVEAARDILEEVQPATVRAVCYRLFVAGAIRSMEKRETQKVSVALTWAREEGHVPWEWIVDETREVERVSTWESPQQIMDACARAYRRDYWRDQPVCIEVWSEKGTVRGTLRPVLDRYGVPFRVMHGFGSATAIYEAARDSERVNGRRFLVLYVGDFDPSGMYMSEVDLPGRLKRYGGTAVIERIALRREDTPGLPWFAVGDKRSDARHDWFFDKYGQQCWELDAMSPPALRARVEQELRGFINEEAWQASAAAERAEVETIAHVTANWQRLISGPVPK